MEIQTRQYFDGAVLHRDGPFVFDVEDGVCRGIRRGTSPAPDRQTGLLTPALVESHAHLFLDGDELDPDKRSAHLKLPRERLLACAQANVERYRKAGIAVVRDAGDIHGINLELREDSASSGVAIIAAGAGIRRAGRYGSFFAREIEAFGSPAAAVTALAGEVDEIKIVLTGIIDFENGVVKGAPQFTAAEIRDLVGTAHALGLRAFAHCSGVDGLRIAADAGVDSIEHGFFMTPAILDIMAEKRVAWTPTLLPVHFHKDHPEHGGWSANAVERLKGILDNHARMLVLAESMGVVLLAGSDAGSFGVRHADGLFAEMALMRQAGLQAETVLRSATSSPRAHLGLPPATVAPGEPAAFALLDDDADGMAIGRKPGFV
jgi:imidazolonepropionase-like amidohydrolase